MTPIDIAIKILNDQLQLGSQIESFTSGTLLLGHLQELDSLSIVGIISSIEEQLGCEVDDDEISQEVFESVGSLADFIESKL